MARRRPRQPVAGSGGVASRPVPEHPGGAHRQQRAATAADRVVAGGLSQRLYRCSRNCPGRRGFSRRDGTRAIWINGSPAYPACRPLVCRQGSNPVSCRQRRAPTRRWGRGAGCWPASLSTRTAPGAGGADLSNIQIEQLSGEAAPVDDKMARDLALVRKYESGGRNIEQGVVGPQGGYNPSVGRVTGPSSASGIYQMIDPTWRAAAAKAGIDTEKYPRAINAPPELQDKAAEALYREQGLAPWAPYNSRLAAATGYQGGGQDTVIPSGPRLQRRDLQNVADTGGGVPGTPPVPVPPGVNPQAMNALLIELAQRNAAAEALGMGNPYGSLLSVLQGSPQYKALIETATRGAGLPFVRQEAEEKAIGGYGVDIATRTYQATLDRVTKALEMEGTARLDPAEIKVADGKGGFVTLQGTREQKIKAANGLAVPELGITGITPPAQSGGATTPPGPGTAAPPAPGAPAPPDTAGTPPPAGSLAQTPVYPPGYAEATTNLLEKRRPKAEAAVQSLNFNDTAQRLLDAGIISGWGASLRLDAAKAKALLGWGDERIANTESFLATQARQVASQLASGAFGSGSSITDNDRQYAAKLAGGDSNLDEASLRFLLAPEQNRGALGNRPVQRRCPAARPQGPIANLAGP